MIFGIRRFFIRPKNCHCNRIVTLTSVTVSDRACTCIVSKSNMSSRKYILAHALYFELTMDSGLLNIDMVE